MEYAKTNRVSPAALELLIRERNKSKVINAATVETASEMAVIGAAPLSRNAYKVQITKTLVKRAIQQLVTY